MLRLYSLADVVQSVWLTARGQRWYSAKELADQLVLGVPEVEAVLSFLAKYGFAELKMDRGMKVRMNPSTPSPADVVGVLRDLSVRTAPGFVYS
jgi:hypothetical protein